MGLIKSLTKNKKSIKLIKLSVLFLGIFNLIYFTIYYKQQNPSNESLKKFLSLNKPPSTIDKPLDEQKDTDSGTFHDEILVPSEYDNKNNEVDVKFNEQLNFKFNQVKNNQQRFANVNTKLSQPTNIKLEIKNHLRVFESGKSWINKNELFYDPKFTLSVYLNEIRLQYEKLVKQQQPDEKYYVAGKINSNELPAISLPFNWADWIDLTVLNNELAKPFDQRMTCGDFTKILHKNPTKLSFFCTDTDAISEKSHDLFTSGNYRFKSQLPNFLIHGHSTHNYFCYNDYRILQGKNYIMTNMKNPLKVMILPDDDSPTGGTFEFNVDSNRRLTSSKMMDSFVQSLGYSINQDNEKALLPDYLNLNHLDFWSDLNNNIIPSYLPKSDYGFNTSLLMRSKSLIELTEDNFRYPYANIDEHINDMEKNSDLSNPHNQMYLDGLKECAKYDNSNEIRYFRMAVIDPNDPRNRDREWGWHYDWRFFNGALNYDKEGWTQKEQTHRTNIIMDRLLRNWAKFANEKGIISWIMHGPLLSWYWNGLLFPYDNDIDIQMPIDHLLHLAKNYNQTLVVENPAQGYGKYLIEVNSYIHNRGISARENHIDARFIDVDTGIYIDITALSNSDVTPPKEYTEKKELVDLEPEKNMIFNDRRKHFYTLKQISPLRYSMLMGVPVLIPNEITNRLVFEYSKGLSSYEYAKWYFVKKLNLWVYESDLTPVLEMPTEGKLSKEDIINQLNNLSNDLIFKLLNSNDDILQEYYLTKSLTNFHEFQKTILFDDKGLDKPIDVDKYNTYKKQFKMIKPLRKNLYDYETFDRLNKA
ncbi:MNN4 Protein MNN4 [Candida maltosa Xu316]